MDATGQIFQISKFPDTPSFVIIPGMFSEMWRKSVKFIPYKFAQSSGIPPRIKCQILAHKGSQKNSRHARRLSGPRKPQTNRTTGPPGVNYYWSRFRGKSNPLQTFFFFYLDCSVERWGGQHNNEESGQRQRKNPLQKLKNCKAEGQDNESTYSFQNDESRRFLMFLYQD